MKKNFWYDFGFNRAGVIVSNYALWLIEQFKQNDIDQVVLFARDGFILKELFDIYSEEVSNLPSYDYILASRRAFLVPAIGVDITKQDVLNILGLISLDYKNLSERLSYLGLNPTEFEPYFAEFQDIAFDKSLSRREKDEEFLNTKLIKKVVEIMPSQSLNERNLIKTYLNEKNALNCHNLALVDGFGHGTCQYYFEKIIQNVSNNIKKINGFYMATYAPYDSDKKYDNITQEAYLFNFAKYDFDKMPITDAYIFELIFGAYEGSFIRFDDELKPLFDKDSKGREGIVKHIHLGVKDYFKKHISSKLEPLSSDEMLGVCSDFMRNPSAQEVINIGDIPVVDADIDRGFCIAKPKLAHLFRKGLKYLWKEAYFKRLNPFL